MKGETYDIALTTLADGTVTAYSPAVSGEIRCVQFIDTDLDATADITITLETSTRPVLALTDQAASAVFYPVVAGHGPTGTISTVHFQSIPVAKERIKVVVAQGGNVKTAIIRIVMG